ncbi:hypothetical protein [Dictyobacter kobayashii]|uniref:Uncharacterized protein n=1 Tax=Dictyobacter kobayashii TaxID=2014872 RepID=A0A402ANI6_9CHLR|nr:hypothetical protein [Dictyobacter kobayashii]GCE20585.1 hypothetical protein KDK_43850 [Dictyobacter kobayashii]
MPGSRVDQQQTPKKYYEDKGYKPQDVAFAIIGAGLANAIALVALTTPFTLWNTIVSIIILCILQAYAPALDSSRRLNRAYAATWSISFLVQPPEGFLFLRFSATYGNY